MSDSVKKIVFIINPIAGKGRAGEIRKTIDDTINTSIFAHRIVESQKAGQVEELANEAVNSGADIIVAVGGDGTVNEIVRVIVHTHVILGIIPMGSGNGLANFLKIPHNIKNAVEIINNFQIQKIDTGTINGVLFVSVAGIGFDASVAKEYAKSTGRGFKTYLKSAVKKYFAYKPAKYKIKFDNTIIARKALFITFANSDQFGYNTSIAPMAQINDGKLDMCIMQKVPLSWAPFVLPRLFNKKIHKSRFHESFPVSEATVYRKKNSVIQVDGEYLKMKSRVIHVVNHKQSLNVIY